MPPTPFVLFGDAPDLQTGLSRLAGDLAARIYADRESLGVEFLHVGWSPDTPVGYPYGTDIPHDWPLWVFSDLTNWGRAALAQAYWKTFGRRPGVVLTCWDPSRAYAATVPLGGRDPLPPDTQRWGYFAIDGENRHKTIGGPAAEAVRQYDRVLAYGPYGAQVMQPHRGEPIPHLPHGLDLTVWDSINGVGDAERVAQLLQLGSPAGAVTLVGCVAANQRRKDFPWFFAILEQLAKDDPTVHGWLHTDVEVGEAWSVPQLAEDFGVGDRLTVTKRLDDADLARLYRACTATVAPGLGEGFGYPIVESLACGTPVVSVWYAEGYRWAPARTVMPDAWRVDGPYAVVRPVLGDLSVNKAAGMIRRVTTGQAAPLMDNFRARVLSLDWPTLWPQWRDWLTTGLEAHR